MLISRARRSAALRRPGGVVIAPKPSDNAVALAVDLASSRVRSSLSRLESAGRSTTLRTAMPAGRRPSTPPSPSTPARGPAAVFAAVAGERRRGRQPRATPTPPSPPTRSASPVPVRGPFMILVSAERRQSGTSPWDGAARGNARDARNASHELAEVEQGGGRRFRRLRRRRRPRGRIVGAPFAARRRSRRAV